MPLLRNSTTGEILATRIDRLTGFLQRAVGLLARSRVQQDEGVWITPCRAIHTIGMHEKIDVIFVDRDDRVLRIESEVAPNRLWLFCRQASGVIELGGGALSQVDVLPRDLLELV